MDNIIKILQARGLFDDQTSAEVEKAAEQPMTVYAGFDPTSTSLQAGNFVTIMALAHFQRCGHKVIAVVGGATGLIGDPSGKASERQLLSEEQVEKNLEGIRENLSRFLDFEHPTAPAVIINNYDWHREFDFVRFLREVGKMFRMGSMLGKESVRARLNSESGMSFTEFSYQLLQAYDFLHLYDTYGCRIQIGGSDQWGNITAGTDLIRKQRGEEAFGVTFPLVCDSSGQKFGKSEGNAIYLDHRMTSYYDFYQFFMRTADADVIRFIRIFSFMDEEQISEFEKLVQECPERREAQRALAEDVTRRVHGEDGLQIAQKASSVLFGGTLDGLEMDDLLGIFANVGSSELPRAEVIGRTIPEVAAEGGLCKSRGEARRLIQNNGMYLNNERVTSPDRTVSEDDAIDGRLLVFRSGKKTFRLVKLV